MNHGFLLTPIDIVITLGATLGAVFIGLMSARRLKPTAEGYFLAGGTMPWWLIGAAYVSTSVSSEQIVGTVGAAYKLGMPVANWEWWSLPTALLMMVFFVPLYLRNRLTTVPELLNRRFGPACGGIYSTVMTFGYLLVFLPPVLYGGSITICELTGWPMWAVLTGIITLTGSYTILGGLGSVMWTDAVQCVLLVGGGIILFFLALGHIPGGWSAMEAAAPDRFHLYRPPTDPEAPFLGLVAGTFGVFLFYQSTNQVMIQRVLSARTFWDGQMGLVFAGFINLIRPLVTCLLGLIVYHWLEVMHQGPSLLPNGQDKAFAYSLATFAPPAIRGIILAGFFAAVMSTVSALANSISTIFTLEIYRRWRKDAGDRELITTGRLATAAALIIPAVASPLVANVGVFKYFQAGVTYMATPFISVLLLGIFWRRTNYAGALAGLIGGVIIQVVLAVWTTGTTLHWLYVGTIAQIATMLVTVVASLCAPAPAAAQVDPFIWRPSWMRNYDEGHAPRPWWQQIKYWFLLYAIGEISIYIHFW